MFEHVSEALVQAHSLIVDAAAPGFVVQALFNSLYKYPGVTWDRSELTLVFGHNETVLFQGDSITDCERDRADTSDMGKGYALIAAAWFSAMHPDVEVRFINRGISGDKTKDLLARWQKDCLDLHPDWVSVLIGVNDTLRRYDTFNRYDTYETTTPQDYAEMYRSILSQARNVLNARLILCEPFLLPLLEEHNRWREEDLEPKIRVVHRLAQEFDAILVPLDSVFTQASALQKRSFWAPDGVHPTPAGHALIAQAWLKAVDAI